MNVTLTTSAKSVRSGRCAQATSHLAAEVESASWVALIPPRSTFVVLLASATFAGSTPDRSHTQTSAPPALHVHQCRLVGAGLTVPALSPSAVATSDSATAVHGFSSRIVPGVASYFGGLL